MISPFQQILKINLHVKRLILFFLNFDLEGRCYSCGRKNHIAKNCSLTHFAPLPVAVVLNPGKYRENERIIGFLRKKEEKWHVFNYNNFKKYEHCVQVKNENND